jgi:iron(III) transport system permease protein
MFNILHRKKELLNIMVALFVALVVALPIIAIFYLALTPEKNIWPHLISTVLPGYITTTLGLLFGVGLISFIIGVGSAWIITIYEFPFRSKLEWLLLIPLAMPTYIIAYSYGELFDYSGPIQTYMRSIFNWNNSKDYWFPDLFTLGGAIFVISFVLYPYVYLTARAAFMRQLKQAQHLVVRCLKLSIRLHCQWLALQ